MAAHLSGAIPASNCWTDVPQAEYLVVLWWQVRKDDMHLAPCDGSAAQQDLASYGLPAELRLTVNGVAFAYGANLHVCSLTRGCLGTAVVPTSYT